MRKRFILLHVCYAAILTVLAVRVAAEVPSASVAGDLTPKALPASSTLVKTVSEPAVPHPSRQGRLICTGAVANIEYSPGEEAYVAALQQQLAARPDESYASVFLLSDPAMHGPLSALACLEQRGEILRSIAQHLGMLAPTPTQQAVYDVFLKYYSQLEVGMEGSVVYISKAFGHATFAIWDREELIRRLKAGEAIENFSYDEATKLVNFQPHLSSPAPSGDRQEMDEKAQKTSLTHSYNYQVKDGIATFSASFNLLAKRPPDVATKELDALRQFRKKMDRMLDGVQPVVFPVVTRSSDGKVKEPAEAAARAISSLHDLKMAQQGFTILTELMVPLYILLHETTEAGIVDRYLGSADRRWFCDGVANYVTWQIARERSDEQTARQVYDLDAQLAQFSQLQASIHLAAWPAVENQPPKDAETALNKAHYAFATRAVAIMHEQGGADILPRLFAELGKTPRKKASMKTVARIYKRLTGHTLGEVLHLAETRPIRAATTPAVPSPAKK
jgi:hypothetical protein